MRGIFITGTGTDVGKTFVSALIVKKIAEKSSAGYFKAAMSGNLRNGSGMLIPGDAKIVRDVSGIEQPLEDMCPFVYENAYSPHLASRIEGSPVRMEVLSKKYKDLQDKFDFLTVEGSGGILCPIRFEEDNRIMLEDIIKEFDLASIIVADSGLGTINSVVLTYEYMKSKGLSVKGIIFNHYHGNVLEDDNIKMCEIMTSLPVIAKISDNATDLGISFEEITEYYE